jgi:glycogen debranching enzyme
VFDYKMIDSSYLLAPVAVAWLLDDQRGRTSAAAFLAGAVGNEGGRSGSRGAALLTNLRLVLESAAPFAKNPQRSHLISLKPGVAVGEWRDSQGGLGGGRYPYDVNAVLVPAALDAAARLFGSGLLTPYLSSTDRDLLGRAAQMAQQWSAQAPQLFDVSIPHETAAHAVETYARDQKIDPARALASLGTEPLQFHALALDGAGKPLPVMHSDEGFALLFAKPDAAHLELAVTSSLRPFPAGLLTGVGMVVANPAFAPAALQSGFSRNAYHGTVVWSWQQALFAAGLERQLHRTDLTPELRLHLQQAQRLLWGAIAATQVQRNSELWSWNFTGGHYVVNAFGAEAADADESNAAQLWSTVYLAVRPPR